MSDRTGLSQGDRNRNSRLARLRVLVPPGMRSWGLIWPASSGLRW
jgi:hypothetical protein